MSWLTLKLVSDFDRINMCDISLALYILTHQIKFENRDIYSIEVERLYINLTFETVNQFAKFNLVLIL